MGRLCQHGGPWGISAQTTLQSLVVMAPPVLGERRMYCHLPEGMASFLVLVAVALVLG